MTDFTSSNSMTAAYLRGKTGRFKVQLMACLTECEPIILDADYLSGVGSFSSSEVNGRVEKDALLVDGVRLVTFSIVRPNFSVSRVILNHKVLGQSYELSQRAIWSGRCILTRDKRTVGEFDANWCRSRLKIECDEVEPIEIVVAAVWCLMIKQATYA